MRSGPADEADPKLARSSHIPRAVAHVDNSLWFDTFGSESHCATNYVRAALVFGRCRERDATGGDSRSGELELSGTSPAARGDGWCPAGVTNFAENVLGTADG